MACATRARRVDFTGMGGVLRDRALYASGRAGPGVHSQPRAASETGVPSPTTMWSSSRTSTSASASLSRTVMLRSAPLGSGLPLGWLWPLCTMLAQALHFGRAYA